MDLSCPACGEAERLEGSRRGEIIALSCLACGIEWERDTTRRCKLCGSDNLRYRPNPLWEKGRGEQHTPAGKITSYACNDCSGLDVTSSNPKPAS